MNINLILVLIAIVWLVVLTSFVVWIYLIFKDLIKISKNKEFTNNTLEIKKIWNDLLEQKKMSKGNIQQVGIVKYNPFEETGGEHSFSLTLLDGNKNGIIITSLHTREKTRVYLKELISGNSKIELSKEERESLKLALIKNK